MGIAVAAGIASRTRAGQASVMRRRLKDAVVDRLLPVPETAGEGQLALLLRRGSPGQRVRAVRAGAQALELKVLLGGLVDYTPGVRRAASWALGLRRDDAALAPLWAAARVERCDTVRLAMAVAAVRLGADVERAWGLLEQAARRRMASFYGPRPIAVAVGAGPDMLGRSWFRALAPRADHHGPPGRVLPQAAGWIRDDARARLERDPEDRVALADLAAQQHPDDLELIISRKWVSGRRESHAICQALGVHGDPRAITTLVQVLRAMDVDPGHGFAGRRAASIALGRVGVPTVGPVLERALVDEALDYEGRPGAGLGIQFPVRAVILTALGEAGCTDQARVLASYLGNTAGSALGGFYLPAMDALWKLGQIEPVRAMLSQAELPASNAVGVLAALGYRDQVRACLSDSRASVAAAATDGLALLAEGDEQGDNQGDPKTPSAS